MVFGLFGSVANDRMFLCAQVRLLIPATVQLPVLYLCITCPLPVYVYFNGFEAAVSAA